MNELAKVEKGASKGKVKKFFKRALGVVMSALTVACVTVTSFAADEALIAYSDVEPIVTALKLQINAGTIVAVLAAVIGACVGMVFMWWGARKAGRAIMTAFRKGKIAI